VAIKQSGGEMKFNPTFRTVMKAGDTLIAVGESSKLKKLEGMAATKK
jgi:K+/H+ antiporter YhaU regulatory subunit KhtT